MDNFQKFCTTTTSDKTDRIVKPCVPKSRKGIEVVAKESGLLYVFDVSSKVVLYKSNQSIDLLPLVKTKLGIK